MEQVATKLRHAGLARAEHRDADSKGLPSEGCSAGRVPEAGKTEHGGG